MNKQQLLKFIPMALMLALLSYGCAQDAGKSTKAPAAAAKKQDGNVYKGSVLGKSNKAKTISISVGKGDKAKTIMVKFDDNTQGVEHASTGHAAIIAYEMRNGEPWATVIKPKLAKLPEGVTEIKTDELVELLEKQTDLLLIDARPAKRYAAAHLPGAVNLSVPDYKEWASTVLPKDKNKLLVFYCGGPT